MVVESCLDHEVMRAFRYVESVLKDKSTAVAFMGKFDLYMEN